MQLKERARDNKGPDPAVVARQHARAQELTKVGRSLRVDARGGGHPHAVRRRLWRTAAGARKYLCPSVLCFELGRPYAVASGVGSEAGDGDSTHGSQISRAITQPLRAPPPVPRPRRVELDEPCSSRRGPRGIAHL